MNKNDEQKERRASTKLKVSSSIPLLQTSNRDTVADNQGINRQQSLCPDMQPDNQIISSEFESEISHGGSRENEDKANVSLIRKAKRKYNFQRASVACIECRKAKTRCNYINDGLNCFRCKNLSLKCSLGETKHNEPTQSSFQKSAQLTIRDVNNKLKSKKRKSNKSSENSPNSLLTPLFVENKDDMSIPLNTEAVKLNNSFTSSGSVSIPIALPPSDYLSIINEKIDKLNENVKLLLQSKHGIPNQNSFGSQQVDSGIGFNNFNSFHPMQLQASDSLPVLPVLPFRNNSTVDPSIQTLLHRTQNNRHLDYQRSFSTMNPVSQPNISPNPRHPQHPSLTPSLSTTIHLSKNSSNNESFSHGLPVDLPYNTPSSSSNLNNQSILQNQNTQEQVPEHDEFFYLNTPFIQVKDVAKGLGFPFSNELGFDVQSNQTLRSIFHKYDIINSNLIDYDTCVKLVEVSLYHYGNWISTFNVLDLQSWIDQIRLKSLLLLCTCVILGLRHYHPPNVVTPNVEIEILQTIHQLISLSTYEVPQSKEFLKSMVLLTLFSPSLSFKHVYFDGWWISSYGLIHFITREMDLNLFVKSNKDPEKVHQFRIWNHLSLSHLMNCILSGRPCLIDELRLDQCRDILELSEATSFDARIVSEISIALSLYNSLLFPEAIEVCEKDLDATFKNWKYLTEQNSTGFGVAVLYKFAKLMIIRRHLLKNIAQKDEIVYKENLKSFLVNASELSKVYSNLSREQLVDSSDMVKMIGFLNAFTLLNFKRLNIITAKSDDLTILDCVSGYLEVSNWCENNINYFNNFISCYTSLIVSMRDSLFPRNN